VKVAKAVRPTTTPTFLRTAFSFNLARILLFSWRQEEGPTDWSGLFGKVIQGFLPASGRPTDNSQTNSHSRREGRVLHLEMFASSAGQRCGLSEKWTALLLHGKACQKLSGNNNRLFSDLGLGITWI
jgi:hypothetical protein